MCHSMINATLVATVAQGDFSSRTSCRGGACLTLSSRQQRMQRWMASTWCRARHAEHPPRRTVQNLMALLGKAIISMVNASMVHAVTTLAQVDKLCMTLGMSANVDDMDQDGTTSSIRPVPAVPLYLISKCERRGATRCSLSLFPRCHSKRFHRLQGTGGLVVPAHHVQPCLPGQFGITNNRTRAQQSGRPRQIAPLRICASVQQQAIGSVDLARRLSPCPCIATPCRSSNWR